MVDLTFGKILNIWEESQEVKYQITYVAIAHVQKVLFLQMRMWVPLKRCTAKPLEGTCNYLDFEAKDPDNLH